MRGKQKSNGKGEGAEKTSKSKYEITKVEQEGTAPEGSGVLNNSNSLPKSSILSTYLKQPLPALASSASGQDPTQDITPIALPKKGGKRSKEPSATPHVAAKKGLAVAAAAAKKKGDLVATKPPESAISQAIPITKPLDTDLDEKGGSPLRRKQQQSSLSQSISRSPASHSIPKAIPRRASHHSPAQIKAATPTSLFMNAATKSSPSGPDDDEVVLLQQHQVDDIIAEHLVQHSDENGIKIPNDKCQSFGSLSHSLKGGAITRDIYKWQENREQQPTRPRSNSNPEVISGLVSSPSLPSVSTLREPGAFRRHFIANKAKREGKIPPNFLTSNFIDFLILYGFYGGDVYPSDDEDDDEYDSSHPFLPPSRLRHISPNGMDDDIEEASEQTPLIHRPPAQISDEAGTSESKAFFMLVKAFVGTGVLFLPKAFSNGGLVFSLVAMAFIGYLTKHCMFLLVETSRAFGGKSFGDLGQIIYGERCKQLVLGSIAVSQMGFCCAYFIFVGQNLRDLLMIASNCSLVWPEWVFILIQLVLYIPLAWVRKIKNFGITSLIADVFILAGLGYIFLFDLSMIAEKGPQNVPLIQYESFSLFIGTAMFAFEGICLMLPIAESMKEPEKFNKVLDNGMLFIGFVFISIGSLGYLALGDAVETNVFLNLPKRPEVTTIQFFYALAIMLSFPLCIYPAIRITEQGIFGLSTGKRSSLIKWEKNLYRAGLTTFLGVTAWVGSTNLDKVVSLVGCFACIPLSFIYPAIFHSHTTQNKWIKLKDWSIVLFGTLAMLYTTYITLQQWALNGPDIPLDRCRSN